MNGNGYLLAEKESRANAESAAAEAIPLARKSAGNGGQRPIQRKQAAGNGKQSGTAEQTFRLLVRWSALFV
jgi:hypothetical protein